ncbi:sugar phosphate isomerase/epimerase [Candidatus Bathyarchaeota archaeon]|nr:sugar phosphate isomerase/epimerase [Candidatus Bathyarchaeota archaeon]
MKLAIQENLVLGKNVLEKLSKIEKYGYEGVEVFYNVLPQMFDELKKALPSSKVKFSTVCGTPSGLLGPDRKTRENALEGIRSLLKMCLDLGGVGVICVPIFGGPQIPDLYPWQPDVKHLEKNVVVEEFKILGKDADNLGVYLLLEPLNRYETHFVNRLEQAVKIVEEVGVEHVQIMADFFHMSIEEQDLSSSIEAASKHIFHVHLADSNRLLPGHGHTEFKKPFQTLKKAGYKYYMALECGVPGDPDVTLPQCVKYLKSLM